MQNHFLDTSQNHGLESKHRARCPRCPWGKRTVTITRHGVAGARFLHSVAHLTTVPGFSQNTASVPLYATFTICCALGPTRPLRHVAIDRTLDLITFLEA